jgi:hypothetical protein
MSGKTDQANEPHATRTGAQGTAGHEPLQGAARARPAGPKAGKMPHERDESARDTGNRCDEALPPTAREITQAHDDIEKGQQDTDRRGVPDDVPSSGKNRGR